MKNRKEANLYASTCYTSKQNNSGEQYMIIFQFIAKFRLSEFGDDLKILWMHLRSQRSHSVFMVVGFPLSIICRKVQRI